MTFARSALLLFAGPLLWAAHFAAIYGFTGLACARTWTGAVPWAVACLTFAAALACAFVIAVGLRRRDVFEAWLGAMLAAAALVAILWEALPALLVPACA